MIDTIYREDAIEALGDEPMVWTLEDEYTMGQRSQWRADVTAIESIPSADRPQGEWIEDPINKNIMYCSNCKVGYTKDFLRGMSLYHEPKDTPDFCPNCGADMREREGE